MNQNCMPADMRDCPFCQEKNGLAYYHERGKLDLYYCQNCFKIVEWDGKIKTGRADQEAYPDRPRIAKVETRSK